MTKGYAENVIELWDVDSDEEAAQSSLKTSSNPFQNVLEDDQEEELENELSAECRMSNFIQRIQSREAVPEYALSDAVFNVDKPRDAAAFGVELPVVTLAEEYLVGNLLILEITEVYSPFQFWFHEDKDTQLLNQMNKQINDSIECASHWQMPPYFMKPGYMCAVRHKFNWRRARIIHGPEAYNTKVSLYFVDYGSAAELPPEDLYFLHKSLMDQPALAKRGTLTDVYPLGYHWPSDVTEIFRHLVGDRQLHACIKDVDVDERILFVTLWDTNDHQVTLSAKLIGAKLAGSSRNYCDDVRALHSGRRLRYVRERLPSFDMLESQLFAAATDEFEDMFDDIIYKTEFLRDFEQPVVRNPFRRELQEALVAWLEKFKPVELAWRKLQEELKKN
ncbi:hypothetical protein ACLKA7_017577 [Drosophila subpalustris]